MPTKPTTIIENNFCTSRLCTTIYYVHFPIFCARVCVYASIRVRVCTYVHMYTAICNCFFFFDNRQKCVCVCVSVSVYLCVCECERVTVCAWCMYVYVCVCVRIYPRLVTSTSTPNKMSRREPPPRAANRTKRILSDVVADSFLTYPISSLVPPLLAALSGKPDHHHTRSRLKEFFSIF